MFAYEIYYVFIAVQVVLSVYAVANPMCDRKINHQNSESQPGDDNLRGQSPLNN